MAACVKVAVGRSRDWVVPPEYLAERVSQTVLNLLLGHHGASRLQPC
jgi:hypothetical protein